MNEFRTLLRGSAVVLATLGLLLTGCGGSDDPEPTGCDPACAEGEHCEDNTCVPHVVACDPACADGESCVHGACVPDAPPAGDQCVNEADGAILSGGEVDATGAAQTCGLGCLAQEDPGACSMTCVMDETGLSAGCAGCYVGTIVCTIDNCVAECAADPTSDDCGACQVDAGCINDFYACSGLTPPAPPAECDPACEDGQSCVDGACVDDPAPAGFCDTYTATCGEWPVDDTSCGDWWMAAADDPTPDIDTLGGANKGCYDYHLGVAGSGSDDQAFIDKHCAHSIGGTDVDGGAPCTDADPPAEPTFCENFATICGEIMACGENGDESCAFADDATCQTWWDAADEDPTPDETTAGGANQGCYSYHLGAAAGDDSADPPVAADPETHCTHAKGEALCVE